MYQSTLGKLVNPLQPPSDASPERGSPCFSILMLLSTPVHAVFTFLFFVDMVFSCFLFCSLISSSLMCNTRDQARPRTKREGGQR